MVSFGFDRADFNNNTHPDISFERKLYLNNRAGSYLSPTNLPAPSQRINMITEGDFDNDGDMDLVSAIYGAKNRLLINDSTGSFTSPLVPGEWSHTNSASFADLNGDGHLDIMFGHYNYPNRLLLNDGEVNYPSSVDIPDSSTFTRILSLGILTVMVILT